MVCTQCQIANQKQAKLPTKNKPNCKPKTSQIANQKQAKLQNFEAIFWVSKITMVSLYRVNQILSELWQNISEGSQTDY